MKHGQEIPRKRIFQVFQAKNNRLIASGLQRFFPKLPKGSFHVVIPLQKRMKELIKIIASHELHGLWDIRF